MCAIAKHTGFESSAEVSLGRASALLPSTDARRGRRRSMSASGRRPLAIFGTKSGPIQTPSAPLQQAKRTAYSSLFSRCMPSMIGCQPLTSEIMKPSICRSPGALSLTVDL